jgi:hypothetical protein
MNIRLSVFSGNRQDFTAGEFNGAQEVRRHVFAALQTRLVFDFLAITNPACLRPPCRC